jgi:hypothetical protein
MQLGHPVRSGSLARQDGDEIPLEFAGVKGISKRHLARKYPGGRCDAAVLRLDGGYLDDRPPEIALDNAQPTFLVEGIVGRTQDIRI